MWAHGGCVWRKAFWFPLLVSISCHVFQRVPLRESREISPAALAFIRRSISHRRSTWWMRSCGTGWIRAKCSTYVDRDAAFFYCLRLCWTSGWDCTNIWAGPANSLFVSEVSAGSQNLTGRDNGSGWWMCRKLDFLSRSQESRVVCF